MIVGFGSDVTGGRGGEVYHVTSLAETGPGTLHEGLQSSTPATPRVIVFDVAGTIGPLSAVYTGKGNLTIDGGTAPALGVCLKGDLRFNAARNVHITNLRIRCLPYANVVKWCLFFDTADGVLVDSCTFSWSTDEMLALHNVTNATVQNCLMHEWCRYYTGGAQDITGKSAMLCDDCDGVTIYQNVMANTDWRAPLVHGGRFQIIANVMYDQRLMPAMVLSGVPGKARNATQCEVVNNLRLNGPAAEAAFPLGASLQWRQVANCYFYGSGEPAQVYASGNLADARRTDNALQLDEGWVHGNYTRRKRRWAGFGWPVVRSVLPDAPWLAATLSRCGPAQGHDAAESRVLAAIGNRATASTAMVDYRGTLVSAACPYHPDDVGGWPALALN